MKQALDSFQLKKNEIKKLESAAKRATGMKCFVAAYGFHSNSINPDWLDVLCEMDSCETGAFACSIKISCFLNDRRRSFTW